jgi:signal transduction histidine kinase/CheY-like chemotaxis protein
MSLSLALPASADVPGERIVIGFDFADPPHAWVDESGEATGFDVDLIRAVADTIGIEYEIRGGAWNEIREQLERGEIDVVVGMVYTPERDDLLAFSVPTFSVAHTFFVPQSSSASSLDDLAEGVIAVERGSVIDDVLPDRLPSAYPLRFETSLEALRAVADGKADAAVLLDSQGLYFIREYGLHGVRSIGRTATHVHYRFAVPHGHEKLLRQLNDGLFRLRESGVYDSLHDGWFGVLQPRGPLHTPAGRALLGATGGIALLLLGAVVWSRTLRRQVNARTRELRESETEARELERQLLQSQKMDALGRLAGGVAHDFDNLLTTIIGNASLALDDAKGEKRLSRSLLAIRRAGQAGADLTRQLLSCARGQSARPSNVSWNDVVGDAREMLQRLIGSRIAVNFEAQPDLWPIRIDPGQALQIVMNLVINARDAVHGSGTITIEAANVPSADGDRVRLSVADDGEGMDAATRGRIFEPFFTTKPSSQGTGLGLSTVYGIVERWEGRIEVESEPEVGSTFHVSLPRAPERQPAEAGPSGPAVSEAAPVLLVEDDDGVRELAGILLRSLGHEVLEASDGQSALDLAREKRHFGLLVTDLDLPGFSGAELARQVLEEFPDTGVLFLSGYAGEITLPSSARVAFLPKPFNQESLADALKTLQDPGGSA